MSLLKFRHLYQGNFPVWDGSWYYLCSLFKKRTGFSAYSATKIKVTVIGIEIDADIIMILNRICLRHNYPTKMLL